MKLHLPLLLLTSLVSSLAAHSTHAAEIPADYESIDLWIPDMLEDYRASDSTGKYAFILWTDMEFTPQTSTSWGASTPLITGGNHIFTTSEGYAPMALSFTSGDSKVFQQVSCLTFDTLSKLTFSNLKDSNYGAAINLGSGSLYIHNVTDGIDDAEQADVLFSGNKSTGSSSYFGGAIHANGSSSVIDISGNGGVSFTGNYISSSYNSYSNGGAIFATGSLSISNNADVSFTGNYTSSYPSSSSSSYVYSYGGAIYATGSLSISNNATVSFTGNYSSSFNAYSPCAHSYGGAIYSTGSLSIVGNESVVFEKNYEKNVSTYRLRSLYMSPDSSSDNLILSAKTGGHITFYDSVYKGYSGTVSFNADYTDEDGITQKAGGDIIFSGQYTAEHLQEIKGGTAGTASEIADSQTSEINSLITLYGGSLQVVDGAKLNGRGLTVAANSGAKLLLRDGSMSHGSYNFTFNSGTTLELQGYNTITATKITMGSGSELTVVVDAGHKNTAALTLGGTDLSTSQLTINLDRTDGLRSGMYKIISQSSTSDFTTKSAWTEANVTINGSGYANRAEFGDLVWQNGTLYYSVGRNIWSNASGDRVWNTSSDNWTMNDRSYTYLDGMDVSFTDAAAGTVKLEGDIAAADIIVNNTSGNDYTFTAAEGGGRLTGAGSLTKQGSGGLTLDTANDYTGATNLEGGTLHVHHSTALGATADGGASVTTAAGTTLKLGNNSHLVLGGTHSLAGAVDVKAGSTLEMRSNGYAAESSLVNGTLKFKDAAADTGTLSGSGTVQVADSQVTVESLSSFTGNLELEGKEASLSIGSGSYSAAGTLSVAGGQLTFGSKANITLNAGGQLLLSALDGAAARLTANNINIRKGATLAADIQASVSPLGDTPVLSSREVGAELNCSILTLNMGAALDAEDAYFDLNNGTLVLAVTKTGTEKINLILAEHTVYTGSEQIVLFANAGKVTFIYNNITATSADGSTYTLNAADYFTGTGINESTQLVYDSTTGTLYLQGVEAIPEPATATLSLLALASLVIRRRRK